MDEKTRKDIDFLLDNAPKKGIIDSIAAYKRIMMKTNLTEHEAKLAEWAPVLIQRMNERKAKGWAFGKAWIK